jgi:hypothetical protein
MNFSAFTDAETGLTQSVGAMKALPKLLLHTALSFIASIALIHAADPVKDNVIRDNESLVQIAILNMECRAEHRHQLHLPCTRDLDQVSEQLFKLITHGGEEYCGAVIREALKKLD